MERESLKRRWTEAEDEALRRRAVVGWPSMRTLAGSSGRSYNAIRHRASRLGAIRVDPARRAARGPTETPCRYCGVSFLSRGGSRYCGGACAALGRGHCPGCGRVLKDLACARCGLEGRPGVWPGPSRTVTRPAP